MQYFEYFDVHFVELNEVIKWTFVSSYKVTCLHLCETEVFTKVMVLKHSGSYIF